MHFMLHKWKKNKNILFFLEKSEQILESLTLFENNFLKFQTFSENANILRKNGNFFLNVNKIWNFKKHFLKSQTNFEKSEHILDIENSSSNSKIVHQILKSSLVFKKSSLNLKKSSSILEKVHGIWWEKFIDFAKSSPNMKKVHRFWRKLHRIWKKVHKIEKKFVDFEKGRKRKKKKEKEKAKRKINRKKEKRKTR